MPKTYFSCLNVCPLFLYSIAPFLNFFTIEAQKSTDMFIKCQYMDEITGGKGTIFSTGTPISNSMTELYTLQRYLQYDKLQETGLDSFDSWASTFGETVTALELLRVTTTAPAHVLQSSKTCPN